MNELITLTCPACGAALKVIQQQKAILCEYCGSPVMTQGQFANFLSGNKNEILLEEARALFRQGNYRAAIETYTRAISDNPSDPLLFVERARSFSRIDERELSDADREKAFSLDPENPKVLAAVSITYMGRRDFNKVIELLDRAINLDPNLADAYISRSFAYVHGHKDIDKAMDNVEKAIELAPKYFRCYYARSLVYRVKDDIPNALKDINLSIQLDPNFMGALVSRGYLNFEIGDYDSSIADFRRVVKTTHKYKEAHQGLASCYEKKNDFLQAISELSILISLDPNNSDIFAQRGNLYYKVKNTDAAIRDYTQAISLGGNYWWNYKNRAEAYLLNGLKDKYADDIKKAQSLGYKG
jgi:tetratricopeptide (TPR) repeat protein